MRQFHQDKQSNNGDPQRRSGRQDLRRGIPKGLPPDLVTQDARMTEMPIGVSTLPPRHVFTGQFQLPLRSSTTSSDTVSADSNSTKIGETSPPSEASDASGIMLQRFYCPSLPERLIMTREPPPPMFASFPMTQDLLRHVHFCE